jgi:hypothetical protein
MLKTATLEQIRCAGGAASSGRLRVVERICTLLRDLTEIRDVSKSQALRALCNGGLQRRRGRYEV